MRVVEQEPMTRVGPYERILQAALEILDEGDVAAVSTRAITERAGVQAPALYRLFGSKNGLLAVAAERAYARWVDGKPEVRPDADPIDALRAGWDDTVQFGLDHPAVYRIVNAGSAPGAATQLGRAHLFEKVQHVAQAGCLVGSPEDAAALLHATGRGVILTLLDTPPEDRSLSLSVLARESILAAVTAATPTGDMALPAAAAALRRLLPAAGVLQSAERELLDLWLQRISTSG